MDTAYESPQDEGYSEDPLTIRNVSDNSQYSDKQLSSVPQWVSNLPVAERTRIVMSIIKGLPTSEIAKIVEQLRPRLCLNFVARLPPEVCLKILGYLDPVSLINVALSSQAAKSLAFDWKTWEHLYYLEGWATVPGEVEFFVAMLNAGSATPTRARPETDEEDEFRASKKRAVPGLVSQNSTMEDEDTEMQGTNYIQPIAQTTSLFGGAIISYPNDDQPPLSALQDATDSTSSSVQESRNHPYQFDTSELSGAEKAFSQATQLPDISNLVTVDHITARRNLNWRNIYTQRRRLEANWDAGKFVNFQIPNPQYLHEAHSECIYTIQFQGRYLVSGSRDKSLRIWDLDTRRLVLPPLIGHTGSVLCLQFDARSDEDLIVSGSSDASVILWKFSTGQAIKVLRRAHSESVLNVRFDKRILVTCSKDKVIKIFNRHDLAPGELGYPTEEAVPRVLQDGGYNPSPLDELPILLPYTNIGRLDGHNAAVNAVQIWNNEIVSASGDRHVKIWDWPLQVCTRTLIGHTKGIACVQYDGRRIVSGSSDNEIKVFDSATGLEIASLRAHSALVRTVQAGFGDRPYGAEEDVAKAKAVDTQYFEAKSRGKVQDGTGTRDHPRNAGSSKPQDITAYGAKLPPGGGGGLYGRIVSGSYDETVKIWLRDKHGVWKVKHTFQLEAAARASMSTSDRTFRNSSNKSTSKSIFNLTRPPSDVFYHHFIDKATHCGPLFVRQLIRSFPQILLSPRLKKMIDAEAEPEVRLKLQTVYNEERQQAVNFGRVQHPTEARYPLQMNVPRLFHATSAPPTASSIPPPPPSSTGASSGFSNAGQSSAAFSSTSTSTAAQSTTPHNPTLGPTLTQQQQQQQQQQPTIPPLPAHLRPESQARVFKLQFDARRIMCCSQANVIVGWDFACGDEKIMEASRFFGAVD